MDDNALAESIGVLLRQRHWRLAVAESCTGGLLAAYITNIPGSSEYFEGGVVAYSNAVKERILHVPALTLEGYGAVSPETATAMAHGVRRLLGADVALSVTGIAGPTGGTPDKPVGLVYIGLAGSEGVRCVKYVWAGDRLKNRDLSARAALELLHDYLVSPGADGQPSLRC